MEAVIKKEAGGAFGLEIIDNNEVEHRIAVGYDGTIEAHQCEVYADKPADRTEAENEYNEQARRFAQYYVYVERGYDTVPPEIHPERLNAVRVALASLSPEAFEQYCGDLYQQLRSYDEPDVDQVIDIPGAAKDADSVLYRKQLYLGLDPRETEFDDVAAAIASRHDLELSAGSLEDASLEDDADLAGWRDVAQELGALADETDADLSGGLEIAGASSLHMAYIDDRGEEHVTDPDAPFDRDPDALLELPVMDVESLAQFQEYVNHNLACQIRDCYVRMGLEPPEPFQVLGYGRFEAAEQYTRLDIYPNYIDPEEQRAFA